MVRTAKVTLSRLDAATCAQFLAHLDPARLDPRGIATGDDLAHLARSGDCFALTDDKGGQCVYVLNVRNGQAWINAAAGQGGDDLTALALPAIEFQSRGLQSVAFQTARRGLVRKAQRHGYRVTGWIMKKDLP